MESCKKIGKGELKYSSGLVIHDIDHLGGDQASLNTNVTSS